MGVELGISFKVNSLNWKLELIVVEAMVGNDRGGCGGGFGSDW